ncbi:inosine/guanosine kinase [Photobacterium damselae]|uniref:Inosine/guanosine kinase n=1 Tax=Photobacterium damselae TaxID=38293 RepID=A0ACD3T4B6_PHODM|nr:inosine/guanosine kinase [Photobacterium damselae]KAB1509982.1 inosine/guanosine kinase [Photobacterium damselae subsp. damselae]MDC4168681.1 inosine/guanosine kinase [Photobacterium damselae]ODA26063.1 inosine/guanosine kinase [Photobacterium damselae subsp. damselae]RDL28641.1 inosine/guanosine kinase [Photobacterium damselae]TLS65670.1 inosine/guanosine kinase [Photobacterium damselae subsp. damselae]
MKFPGQRKSKHYFPVHARDPLISQTKQEKRLARTHVVGIDQTLVDIEAYVNDDFLERYNLSKGHSLVITDEMAEALYRELKDNDLITHEFAGGTIGNTLHNYSVLADDKSVLLGVMSKDIEIGSYAYRYLCNTSSRMDMNFLQPVTGPIGRCFALISPEGERTFAINEGRMNQLHPDSIPESVFENASALVLTAYLVRCKEGDPMPAATMRAIEYAKKYDVPVVLTLGTKFVIQDDPQWWRDFLRDNVTVVAMNEDEGEALTGESDPLVAADKALEWVDLVLCTAGPVGLYMAGYTEDDAKRQTSLPLLPGDIAEFNQYEFSRPMLKEQCKQPIKVYSHIAPYMGGPERIKNTNGAGDGALSALLHDMSANRYHKENVPNSSKHQHSFLTYSSFSQICLYANRVSYEVLAQYSPRLSRGLPEREDSLEEAYWER